MPVELNFDKHSIVSIGHKSGQDVILYLVPDLYSYHLFLIFALVTFNILYL